VCPHDHKLDVSDQRERTEQHGQSPGRRVQRLFIGIPLAAATANDLTAAVNQLRSKTRERAPDSLRWSAAESWHITLQFLGSTTQQQYDCVIAHLRELQHARVPIELGTIDTFDRAGVLFADVRVTPKLRTLQQAVTAATAPCGFTPEERPYHPHITLARRKGKSGARELRDLKPKVHHQPTLASFTAESFILYESIPTPEGSRYEVRERFMLSAPK
jgi:RNA 2',3'-cyclic 3'-phosphodiesterase